MTEMALIWAQHVAVFGLVGALGLLVLAIVWVTIVAPVRDAFQAWRSDRQRIAARR